MTSKPHFQGLLAIDFFIFDLRPATFPILKSIKRRLTPFMIV
jgi:hypothetical protein